MNGSPSTAKTEIARGAIFTLKRVMAGSPLAGGCFLGKTLALKRTP